MSHLVKYRDLFNATSYFYKLAALKFEKEDQWIPEEFRNKEVFQKYPYEKLIKTFEQYGLKDFQIKIDYPFEVNNKIIIEKIADICNETVNNLNYIKSESSEIGLALHLKACFYKLMKQLYAKLMNNDDDLHTTEEISGYFVTEKYQAGTNIILIYNDLKKQCKQLEKIIYYLGNLPTLTFDHIKQFSKKRDIYLVFSTKISDLAGIASRGIESCQSLFKNDCVNLTTFNEKLVGTILSKYIGTCYITTGKDFKGRGQRILYRALVRQIAHIEDKKPVMLIDQLYPFDNYEITKIMKEELQKRSSIPVKLIQDFVIQHTSNEEPSFIKEDYYSPHYEEDFNRDQFSYEDNPLTNLQFLRENAKSGDPHTRADAGSQLPISELDLLINDTNPYVIKEIINRLPADRLKYFAEHQTQDAKLIAVKNLTPNKLDIFINDESSIVRAAVAKRISIEKLHLMKNDTSNKVKEIVENRLHPVGDFDSFDYDNNFPDF